MLKKISIFLILLFSISLFAQADKEKKAKEMVEKGIAFLQKNKWKVEKDIMYVQKGGKWVSLGEILRDPKNRLKEGEFYLFVLDMKGIVYAHGEKKELDGKNMIDLKDTNGKEFVKEYIKVIKEKGEGWVDYTWPNPVTKKIGKKNTYLKRFGKEDFFVLCGYYVE